MTTEQTAPEFPLPVAILAGGLATRLGPLTKTLPKSLVPINGEPFLAHQIRLLRHHGLKRIVLCAGHLGEMIEDRFGDGRDFDVELRYSFDGEKLLGTGGALKRALPLLGEAFFVVYGDSYLEMDYLGAYNGWKASSQAALMSVFHNQGRFDQSNVWFENGQIRVYDKFSPTEQMQFIDHGLGILCADLLKDYAAEQAFDLATVYADLSAKKQLAGFEVKRRFYEVGSHQGIGDLENHLQNISIFNNQ